MRLRDALRGRLRDLGVPETAVLAAVAFCAWHLRPELTAAWRPNDAAIHASLVRWVAARLTDGHLPFDGWYPYLSLGAARFHHYQSLPHILTGATQALLGSERVFAWSLYLLLATWPVAVYLGGRLLGLGRPVAGAAAVIAPLIASTQRMGIQWDTYVWRGYGAWAQLWGMWVLPVALGLTWQAIVRARHRGKAATALALLVSTHLIVSYAALLIAPIWAMLGSGRLRRLRRAALVGGAAMLGAAWFLVPLLTERAWMTRDRLASPIGYRSIGARLAAIASVNGQILDADVRLPIITVLAAGGLALCAARARRDEPSRALLALAALGFILFSGRTSFGLVLDLLPGMQDIFMSRFLLVYHVAGAYLAGIGLVGAIEWTVARQPPGRLRAASATIALCAMSAALLPALAERGEFMSVERGALIQQATADREDLGDIRELLDITRRRGPGRVYAGLREQRDRWFRVGWVPVYLGLVSEDVDAIGFTRPTWSILSNVESLFDDTDPRQYPMLGIRYVLTSTGIAPEVPAELIAARPCCDLWELPGSGYFRLTESRRAVDADRLSLLARARAFLASPEFDAGGVWTIGYAGRPAAEPLVGEGDELAPSESLGRITSQQLRLTEGWAETSLEAYRTTLVVLSATYDPGWTASVDGIAVEPQMVAPGVVAVRVEPGTHRVTFAWRPFPHYLLLLLGWAAPLVLARRRWKVFEIAQPVAKTESPGSQI